MCKSKFIIAVILVSSLLMALFSPSAFAEERFQGMNIGVLTSKDIIPDFSVDAITAVLVNDDIEFRLYFTGKGIVKYNMFNPPSGDKLQIIKEFTQEDIDNGYMSFRYSFEEIKKFGTLTIFVNSEYSVTKSYYLSKEKIDYTQVPRIIEFKDANMDKSVKAAIKVKGSLLSSELGSITKLDLSDSQISSIEGIELFTNLQELDLSNNSIKDVSALKSLSRLNKLYLKNNPIADYYQLNPFFANLNDNDFKKDYSRAEYAVKLKEIGVFKGTDQGFELSREPTRLEGLIMLIRLLGKEAQALAGDTSSSIYSDVPSWAVPYTNYAYETGLTSGIGNKKFGCDQKLDAKSYVTLILRALGYDDKKGDFTWNNAVFAAQTIGLYDNAMQIELNNDKFLRAHFAELSYKALGIKLKGEEYTLIEKQVKENIIDRSLAEKMGFRIP